MTDVTLFHNPRCSTSRHAYDELADSNVEVADSNVEVADSNVEVVEYLKTPLDRTQLLALIDKLDDPPADLVRKDAYFKKQGLDADDYTSPDAVADLLVEHPRLMERPVIVRGERAIIGRPKHRVAEFMSS